MKLQILSDLHLEFGTFDIPETDADVIVLAGDIHIGTKAVEWMRTQTKKPVIYIAGNHEYYGKKNTFPDLQVKLRNACEGTNIYYLENESVIIDGVRFLGCTLWTNYALFGTAEISMYDAETHITDFSEIKANIAGRWRRLRPMDCFNAFKKSKRWLAGELIDHSLPTVVVTHHAPSHQSSPKEYEESCLAPAYASKLDDFIMGLEPKLWIHGHMHNNSDYIIGETRVLCNPRGYVGYELNSDFDPAKIVEVWP